MLARTCSAVYGRLEDALASNRGLLSVARKNLESSLGNKAIRLHCGVCIGGIYNLRTSIGRDTYKTNTKRGLARIVSALRLIVALSATD